MKRKEDYEGENKYRIDHLINTGEPQVDVPEGSKCFTSGSFECKHLIHGVYDLDPCMENSGATSVEFAFCAKFDKSLILWKGDHTWEKINYCEQGFTPQDQLDDFDKVAKLREKDGFEDGCVTGKGFQNHLWCSAKVEYERFGTGLMAWAKDFGMEYKRFKAKEIEK